MVIMTFVAYGAVKFGQLMSKHNPFISEITETNFYDYKYKLDLNAVRFKQAFSVEGYLDKEMKDDPRYIKFIPRIYGKKQGVRYQEVIPFHKCTEEDWLEFYEPAKGTEDQLSQVRDDPKRGMYCLDHPENFEINGNENNSEFQYVDILVVPCNYLHTEFGYN